MIHKIGTTKEEGHMLKQLIKPSDMRIKGGLVGSLLKDGDKEEIALNIIVLSLKNDNQWLEFTWEEYRAKCDHEATVSELTILESLVAEGLLERDGEKFVVRDAFIARLWDFVNQPVQN